MKSKYWSKKGERRRPTDREYEAGQGHSFVCVQHWLDLEIGAFRFIPLKWDVQQSYAGSVRTPNPRS